ncbi:hypothetical protein CPC735_051160 [Coccidioides posadasii C735 delta SOWgp]|uniref:RING-type domain-containing protein n=1 Tax=Coccidioides posadasii (strain C735) TaxID=222929 RepID=C5PGU3_COCP7|nr:hypothetical protein CPC735_051160 [Coccidioides posadasii C735 delta SOWgp]EER23746.1 hypothetical protein CPC735_051160 [Coccidioides posadasii C735 delta SOWgp]|eukprot:XP_003065891.1 hypothetical protein CPC735_051160 [Coccidioides posadasii C735 delta SOWgp]
MTSYEEWHPYCLSIWRANRSFNYLLRKVEHSTTPDTNTRSTSESRPNPRHRRPDLSTFFATLNEISHNPSEPRTRPYAVPVPGDVSAAFRSLAEALDVIRRETESGGDAPLPVYDGREPEGLAEGADGGLIGQMIRTLLQDAEAPPREVEGVSEVFVDDDPYPLVVRLPCHTSHLFDLECVRPWLRLRGTCPLDRFDFGQKERDKERERIERMMKRGTATEDDQDEDWDGMYG